jgi:hypothetical protein
MPKWSERFSTKPEIPSLLNKFIFLAGFWLFTVCSQAQSNDSLRQRKKILISANTVAYTGAMTGLYQLWYKDYPMEKFHFFNDNAEWLQMDKLGHAYSCYYEGLTGIQMMRWAGYSEKASIWIGGSYGWWIQAGVEIMDGFSKSWGASWGDLMANTLGSALVIGQELTFKEQRVTMKLSYAPTFYAQYRPNVLGSSHIERLFKDYNGQIYWLSTTPATWLPETSKLPRWLGLAVGYGAHGMTGGFDNLELLYEGVIQDPFERKRQGYLAADLDLRKIPVKKKWLKSTLFVLNCVKFPMPGVSFEKDQTPQFQWIAF